MSVSNQETKGSDYQRREDSKENGAISEEFENNITIDSQSKGKISRNVYLKQIGVSLAVSMMDLSCGVALGYTGIILPSVTDPKSEDIFMDTHQVSTYSSLLLIGGMMGNVLSSPLVHRYGQRRLLQSTIPLAMIGWLMSYASRHYWLLVLSRIIVGVATSVILACSCTYISEISHLTLRGRLVAFTDLARQVGILFVFSVGSSNLDWRTVGLVCGLVPLLIPGIVLCVVPNSPRWIAMVGRPEREATSSLSFYRGENYEIKPELDQIQEEINRMNKTKSTFANQIKMMKEKSLARRMLLLSYLNIALNFSGVYAFLSYTVLFFESTGYDAISPYTSTVISGGIRLFGAALYLVLVDSVGRRPMLLIFMSLSCLSTSTLALFFFLKINSYDVSVIQWLPLVCLFLYTLCIPLWIPVIRLFRSELLPNSFRGLGVNVLYFLMYFGSFVVSYAHPFMVENIGSQWIFCIYSLNSLMMVLIIYFFLPESKGKSLEELAKHFK